MKYKRAGIICAMKSEAEALIVGLSDAVSETVGTLTFTRGFAGKREVIVCVSGVGKVFAAMCAQTLILRFAPDCILNSGVAGSLSPELEILSLAISRDLVQHDMDTSPVGDPVGMISGLNLVNIPATPDLTESLQRGAQREGIPHLVGTIASGDQFIAEKDQKEKILSRFSPIACEMEGGAVAQVCYANRIPFCVIRSISDSFSGKSGMDYSRFLSLATRRGADFLLSLLKDETFF